MFKKNQNAPRPSEHPPVVSHLQRIGCQLPKKLLYTVANPARGLLNRGKKKSGISVARSRRWTFVLFCFVFRPNAFVEAAALRSIVLRYAGAPIAARVFFFFFLFVWVCLFFRVFFVPLDVFSLYGKYVVRFPLAGWCFFTLCWIFDISLRENSIKQPIMDTDKEIFLFLVQLTMNRIGNLTRRVRGQGILIFPVQLTTSRIGNLAWLTRILLYVMTIHTYI